jgi:phage FluMu protein Com
MAHQTSAVDKSYNRTQARVFTYICGHCNQKLGDRLARASPTESQGVIHCSRCQSINAVRSPSPKAFLSTIAVVVLSFCGKTIIEPSGILGWLWSVAEIALVVVFVHFGFLRRKLPVVGSGPRA